MTERTYADGIAEAVAAMRIIASNTAGLEESEAITVVSIIIEETFRGVTGDDLLFSARRLERGEADAKAGNVRPLAEAMADLKARLYRDAPPAPTLLTTEQREALEEALAMSDFDVKDREARRAAIATAVWTAMHPKNQRLGVAGIARWLLAADRRLRGAG